MKKHQIAFLALTTLLFFSCSTGVKSSLYKDSSLSLDERVSDLVNQMTIEEKIGQMTQVDRQFLESGEDIATYFLGSLLSGGGSAPVKNNPEAWADMYDSYQAIALTTRLGIPLIYGVDAVHGHNNVYGATIFPHNIGLGAAGDEDLVERIARATAVEVAATGVDWNFAPCVTVPRDERWGRTYEGFGEEPELVSRLGAAAIRGYQGDDLSEGTTILATAKHFVADGATEGGVDRGDAKISEEELREIHLFPYIASIEEESGSVMASFSSWNGVKIHGHSWLLQDVLRGEMGFDGFIVSDWEALSELPETYEEQIALGINSGIDMIMVPDKYKKFIEETLKLVEEGEISLSRIDEAVSRIIKAKMELALFEAPMTDKSLLKTVGSEAHRELAREAVRKSQVLLKNDGVLPLSKDIKSVLVTGALSDNMGGQCGGWTISWQGSYGDITEGTTILEGIKEVLGDDVDIYTTIKSAEGVDLDAVIVVIGEKPYAEWQGDNKKLSLMFAHRDMVKDVKALGVPTITVLVSGRPLMVKDQIDQSDAFIAAWLPGSEGAGVADVIFGDYSPTGKLPVSWPRSIEQLPINVGDEDYDPLFPFGFGLTY